MSCRCYEGLCAALALSVPLYPPEDWLRRIALICRMRFFWENEEHITDETMKHLISRKVQSNPRRETGAMGLHACPRTWTEFKRSEQ